MSRTSSGATVNRRASDVNKVVSVVPSQLSLGAPMVTLVVPSLSTRFRNFRTSTSSGETLAQRSGILRSCGEFIAAVIVGAALGWVLDRWAGTSPWGLIVFLLLGFAAGVVNVMRATGQMAEFGQQGGSGRDGRGK